MYKKFYIKIAKNSSSINQLMCSKQLIYWAGLIWQLFEHQILAVFSSLL